MTPGVVGKIFLWWLGLLALAILNGALREKILVPHLGVFAGYIASGLLLCALVLAVALLVTPTLHYKAVNLWIVGALWLFLTLGFEFTFGLGIQHKSLADVMHAYTFAAGNLWPIVLLMIFLGPRLAGAIRGLH